MKRLATLLIASALVIPLGTVRADETTAPGQQKKAAGDGSAKEYTPGQNAEPGAGASANEHKTKDAAATKDKKHHKQAKGEKVTSGSHAPAPSTEAPKPKKK